MKNKKLLLIPAVLLVAALVGWLLLRDNDNAERIEASGTIEGTEADLGFQLGGRVAQVNGREGDRVAAATILARLDQDELEARKSAA
ncbi:MAG TPA: biotin/lipoyl-binding protein, partial [Longimicrobiales bacterium]